MQIIRKFEKEYYGHDSYFYLMKTGQYCELQHEDNYSGPLVTAATIQIDNTNGKDSDNVDNLNDIDSNIDCNETGEETKWKTDRIALTVIMIIII